MRRAGRTLALALVAVGLLCVTAPTSGAGDFRPVPLALLPTAVVDVNITSSPEGLLITVDGTNWTTPQRFQWENGSVHVLAVVPSQTTSQGVRQNFTSWSDGGAAEHNLSVTGPIDLLAAFVTEYQVTLSSSPRLMVVEIDGVSALAPTSAWVTAGSTVEIHASGAQQLSTETKAHLMHWSDGPGPENRLLLVDGPKSIVAEYVIWHRLQVNTSAGAATACYLSDCWYEEGTTATFALRGWPAESGGTREDFRGWTAEPGNVSVTSPILMDGPKRITAQWVTQYYLAVEEGYGSASGAGWYDGGSVATLSVSAGEVSAAGATWRFGGWQGPVNATSPQIQLAMDGPKNVSVVWNRVSTTTIENQAGISLVVVLVAFAAVGAAAARTPRGEYALASLALPLFTRLRGKDVRNQYNRGRLMQYIEDNPGANYSEIRRKLQLGNGGCAHHLRVLEREHEIRRVVEGATVRFYPAGYKFDAERLPPLAYLQRQILGVLVERKECSFAELSELLQARSLEVGQTNLSYHLKVLSREKQIVSTRRDGRRTIYSLEGEQRVQVARRLQQEGGVDAVMERATFGKIGAEGTADALPLRDDSRENGGADETPESPRNAATKVN